MEEPNNNFPSSTLNNNFNTGETIKPQQTPPENSPQTQNINLPMEFNNYPMPNRKDSMSNRGLDETDFPKRKFKQLSTKRDFSLNNYSLDIEGAAPRSNSIFINKTDFTCTNQDIEKSSPKKVIPEKSNKPNYNLSNRDIEGTLPRGHHCFATSRHCDPLNPVYPLPSSGIRYPPEIPKFLRDTLNVRDIPGASAKENKIKICETEHNYMDVYRRNRDDDILLDHKKLYKGNKNKLYNSLDFRDVYKIPPFSNRHTNPLEPKYKYDYKMTEINNNISAGNNQKHVDSLVYGEIEGNRPVVFSKYNNERYGKGMKTTDIQGAQPSTTSSYAKFQLKYKHPLKYSAEDIVGAHHDTLLKSIITKRNTNPLDPKYTFLGDKGMDFDEDSRKFRAKFDYSSLYDFYYKNSKVAIKQREDEMKQNMRNNNFSEAQKRRNKIEKKKKKIFFNFGEDKKVYPVEKVDNTENEKKKIVGENYLKMLKERDSHSPNHNRAHSAERENEKMIEDTIKKDFPDPKDIPEFNEYNKFNDKNYSKPEINYAYQHEQFIIPSNPNNKSGKDVSIKVLQDLQNNFENARDYKKPKTSNNSNTYANQLDKFISKFPGIK